MKLLRITLVCSLLLLAAAPTYALPCKGCIGTDPICVSNPNSGTRCFFAPDTCEEFSAACSGFTDQAAAPAMLAEWTVASIEISRPSDGTKVVTSPAAVVEANVARDTIQK